MNKPAWAGDARQGPVRRHEKIAFFACEGLIAMYDERGSDERYSVVTPTEFELRANALAAGATRAANSPSRPWLRGGARKLLADCQGMLEAVKEARHMGDPSDPAVQAFWSRHVRNGTVVMSGSPSQPPPAPRGRLVTEAPPPSVPLDDLVVRKLPTRKNRGGIVLGAN